MKLKSIDNEKYFDWGKTSKDYARYREGYPESFYDTLCALGIGIEGQQILDLGTGTGVLARAFARHGAHVIGADIAENQIQAARDLATEENLDIEFRVSPAEDIELPDGSLDVVSAGQSWLYFDNEIMIPKVLRMLKETGCLVLTHLLWLPYKDDIARQMEELVLKYNPDWQGAHYNGAMPAMMPWAKEAFELKTFHVMEMPLTFTHESWRGRIRACRGTSASLPPDMVAEFDAEHQALLEKLVPDTFEVLHQMTIHVLVGKGTISTSKAEQKAFV
ncbi:MAG: class I SAM-dependent methyltransferase [Pseudomonadota bacterium]